MESGGSESLPPIRPQGPSNEVHRVPQGRPVSHTAMTSVSGTNKSMPPVNTESRRVVPRRPATNSNSSSRSPLHNATDTLLPSRCLTAMVPTIGLPPPCEAVRYSRTILRPCPVAVHLQMGEFDTCTVCPD